MRVRRVRWTGPAVRIFRSADLICARPDGEADAGNAAVRIAAPGFLASPALHVKTRFEALADYSRKDSAVDPGHDLQHRDISRATDGRIRSRRQIGRAH